MKEYETHGCQRKKRADPCFRVTALAVSDAPGRTRTGTASLPGDFESPTSTNSITGACTLFYNKTIRFGQLLNAEGRTEQAFLFSLQNVGKIVPAAKEVGTQYTKSDNFIHNLTFCYKIKTRQ